MRLIAQAMVICLCVIGAAAPVDARVARFVVERTTPYGEGRTFGDAGQFERLEGTAYFEVDPNDPLNAVIVNLDRAPRNGRGLVEFSAPFVLIKPVDGTRGNDKLLFGLNNRGLAIEIPFQSFPPVPIGSTDVGDGLLFKLGFSFVDAGWAGDIETTETRLGATLPIAVQPDGSAIVAPIRIEYRGDGYTFNLKGDERFVSYETSTTDTSASTLIAHDEQEGTRTPVAADGWAFGRCPTGRASLTASTTDICLFDGFDPNTRYELTYPAKNPWVMGLSYAVVRDLTAFLRYATADDEGSPNPLHSAGRSLRRVYGLGISSTGMFLRDFLYLGFNESEQRRQVFDAVRIHIAGTHRLFANVEFADPNVYARQDHKSDFTSHSIAPLTYAVTTDQPGSFHLTHGLQLPFLFQNSGVAALVAEELYPEYLKSEYERMQVYLAHCSATTAYDIISKTPVRTPSDLRGLKVRSTGGLTANILREIGATPVVLPTSETYTAFQRGIIDAVALGAPDMAAYRLQEIGNYFLPLRLTHTVIQYCLNPRTFDGLPADLRLSLYNLFRLVGQLANINFYGGEALGTAIETIEAGGVEILEPTPDERQEWVEAARPIEQRFIAENEKLGLPAGAFIAEAKERSARYEGWSDQQLWDHVSAGPVQGVIDF